MTLTWYYIPIPGLIIELTVCLCVYIYWLLIAGGIVVFGQAGRQTERVSVHCSGLLNTDIEQQWP